MIGKFFREHSTVYVVVSHCPYYPDADLWVSRVIENGKVDTSHSMTTSGERIKSLEIPKP
jgi:hypothetical protein